MPFDADQATAYVSERLSPERIKHVLGVRETVLDYARVHGLSAEDAEAAALLHDCAKWMPIDRQIAVCEAHGIELSEDDLAQPSVLHAFAGAELARETFGASPEVCRAIRAHTTGWVPMDPLDMALYVADYTEPNRTHDGLEPIRQEARRNLVRATLRTMDGKLRVLLDRGTPIHPRTVSARNALIRLAANQRSQINAARDAAVAGD